jgi:alpha-beta hydrolase superfamily lysophospholipase
VYISFGVSMISQNSKFLPSLLKRASSLGLALAFGLSLFAPAIAQVQEDTACKERVSTGVPLIKWENPEVTPRGSVVLVHGLTQRGQCLAKLGKELAEKGYIVWAIDQRGHGFYHFGQKAGSDGYVCDYKQSQRDLVAVLKAIKVDHPDLPSFCIGESAGAAIIAGAAANAPDFVNGIVLASTGIKCCRVKLSWTLHDVACNWYRINHPVDVVRYQRKYGSDDKHDFSDQELDPWVRRSLSIRELVRTKNIVGSTAKVAKQLDPSISILVLQAGQDHVLRAKSARKVLRNAKTPYKQFVVVPRCGHVMLGTNYLKPLVVSSINSWLDEQTSTQTVARANTGVAM